MTADAGWAPPDDPGVADLAGSHTSAYVHIPFCGRLCPYCDFAVVTGQDDQTERYMAALLAEFAMESPAGPLDSVFVGGGTPSRLTPDQMGRLITALAEAFGLEDGAEVTMEANPEDWTQKKSDGMASAGVTRVSFGAQSFDLAVLQRLGRVHEPATIVAAARAARQSGFTSVSLDLIFGHPSESLGSWQHTLAEAVAVQPDHLSTYALTVERGTELSRLIASGAPAPDEDDQADKYLMANEALEGAGYTRYEVSNHARPGHTCRYNLTTWAQGDYLAFGLGAHGHRAGTRRRNVRRLEAYVSMVESGRRPEAGREHIEGWAREQERLMLGLRRTAGVRLGSGGEALLASERGHHLTEAGVAGVVGDRLCVKQPLLTDTVIREVLALPDPAGS